MVALCILNFLSGGFLGLNLLQFRALFCFEFMFLISFLFLLLKVVNQHLHESFLCVLCASLTLDWVFQGKRHPSRSESGISIFLAMIELEDSILLYEDLSSWVPTQILLWTATETHTCNASLSSGHD